MAPIRVCLFYSQISEIEQIYSHRMVARLFSRLQVSLKSSRSSPLVKDSPAPFLTTWEASFMQGLLNHLPATSLFSHPCKISYAHMAHNNTGERHVCWGTNNRAYPVRLAHSAERGFGFEVNTFDGLANPYLTAAAVLTSGILGMEKGGGLRIKQCRVSPTMLQETQRNDLGIVRRMPLNLEDARRALRVDDILRDALGRAFVEQYLDFNEVRH